MNPRADLAGVRIVYRAVCLASLAALLLISPATAQQVLELKPGSVVERDLSGGQTQEFRVSLNQGDFFDAVVEQKGIDVAVTLLAPDGHQIGLIDSLNGPSGPEPMVAIADTTGEYRLRVAAGNPQAGSGRYEIRLQALRPHTTGDKQHVAANRLAEQALDLYYKGETAGLKVAAEKFHEALTFYHSRGLRYDEALSLYSLGIIQAQLGDFHAALGADEQALEIFHGLRASTMEGNTIDNMGGAYDVLGDLPKALDAHKRAIPILRSGGDRLGEASALNNIGKLYADMADWQQASDYYQQALSIFHAEGDLLREGVSLSNLAGISFYLGNYQKALNLDQQALVAERAAGDKRGEAATLGEMASTHQAQGQLSEAVKLYQQALDLARSAGDRWQEGTLLRRIAVAKSESGKPQEAIEQLQQSIQLLRAASDRRGEGLALNDLAHVYAKLNLPDQALTTYQQALAILQGVGDRSRSAEALQGMARVERDQGRLIDARQHSDQALALVEQVRAHAGAQEDRASYFATQQTMGEFSIDLLMRLHRQEPAAGHDIEAFEAAERQRARSLLEMLAEARVDIRRGVAPKLLDREHEINGLLNSDAQRLFSLHGAGAEEKAAALKKEIADRESELHEVELSIRKSSPQYSAITQPQPLTLKELQAQVLDDDTVLLEYALGEERSYLWAVTPSSLKSYELAPRSQIESTVREVVELLSARATFIRGEQPSAKKARIAAADANLPAAAARLSALMLTPAAADLGAKRLVLVTDGSLQHVPFAMLPNPGARTLLVEQHEIVSLPSASTVSELRKQIAGRAPAPRTIAVLADPVFQADDPRVARAMTAVAAQTTQPASQSDTDDASSRILVHLAAKDAEQASQGMHVPRLPFTRQEADRIIKLAGANDSLEALDFKASVATATSGDLGQYRYLHFATHGYLDSEQPELSAVVLALVDEKGQPEPGFLRANDIYNLKLPADLVVLSACETGLGKELRGEGIVGLTRAFMYAGAPRVIVSLWSVNDRATEELMAAFYQKLLKEKLSPSAALRQAQIRMAKDKQWSAPFYWAAFVQQGEWK